VQGGDFVACGDEGRLDAGVLTGLRKADCSQKSITEALAADCFGRGSSFEREVGYGFSRAPINQFARLGFAGLAKVAEIADSLTRCTSLGIRNGAGHL